VPPAPSLTVGFLLLKLLRLSKYDLIINHISLNCLTLTLGMFEKKPCQSGNDHLFNCSLERSYIP
jgi:hypothetical protein